MSADLPAASVKRAQSEEPTREQSPKRRRISPANQSTKEHAIRSVAIPAERSDGEPTAEQPPIEQVLSPQESTTAAEIKAEASVVAAGGAAARAKSGKVDEKQRSRRLFGSLLGTLGQGADRTIKRRQEIEDRRKAELQRQDGVRAEDRYQDVEQLKQRRKSEQWHVDEEDMRIRHRVMRNTANFLHTEALPRLYYRPWELRADEERILKEQRQRVEDRIDDEADEFELRRRQAMGDDGPVNGMKRNDDDPLDNAASPQHKDKPGTQKDEADPATIEDQEPNGEAPLPATNENAAAAAEIRAMQQEGGAQDRDEEHDEGHMVEREEDTVIY